MAEWHLQDKAAPGKQFTTSAGFLKGAGEPDRVSEPTTSPCGGARTHQGTPGPTARGLQKPAPTSNTISISGQLKCATKLEDGVQTFRN